MLGAKDKPILDNPRRILLSRLFNYIRRRATLWATLTFLTVLIYNILLYGGVFQRVFYFNSNATTKLSGSLIDDVRRFSLINPTVKDIVRTSIVGPYGSVVAPYSRYMYEIINGYSQEVIAPFNTEGKRGENFSIIISVRNEDNFLPKTILYLFEYTPLERIREVIIIDDNSHVPVKDLLTKTIPEHLHEYIHIIRFNEPQGLIRGRYIGADMAKSDNLFFLDGHCRPKAGWEGPLLDHLRANYRRVACPVIYDIHADSWEDVGTFGTKMMFEWTFEFNWYDDLEAEVPIMPGGIYAITKKWWEESGKYDDGMLEWGGENLEQSLRMWMCGGEIVGVRQSKIGHIFDRPAKPNPNNSLVIQVQKNQKRCAKVWLDEYYTFFYYYHQEVRRHVEGDISERISLRTEKLNCVPFQWYVERFRTAFERRGLLDDRFFQILHPKSGRCLAMKEDKGMYPVVAVACNKEDKTQHWQIVFGGRMLYNRAEGCLDANYGNPKNRVITYQCDWNGVIRMKNSNQFWMWDAPHADYPSPNNKVFSWHIFLSKNTELISWSGSDRIIPSLNNEANSREINCLQPGSGDDSLVYYVPCEPSSANGPMHDEQAFVQKILITQPTSNRFGKRAYEEVSKITESFAVDKLHKLHQEASAYKYIN